jgi:predicted RNA-binding protein YlxR (DUF448 family)
MIDGRLPVGVAPVSRVVIRTCIGCRRRSATTDLLRLVAEPAGRATPDPPTGGHVLPVIPDPAGRLPGRGAWLHPDPECLAWAERRRAIGRALRLPGPIDPSAVHDAVATWEHS